MVTDIVFLTTSTFKSIKDFYALNPYHFLLTFNSAKKLKYKLHILPSPKALIITTIPIKNKILIRS